jgi:hypothetical protein
MICGHIRFFFLTHPTEHWLVLSTDAAKGQDTVKGEWKRKVWKCSQGYSLLRKKQMVFSCDKKAGC